jgi:hypothetical protein
VLGSERFFFGYSIEETSSILVDFSRESEIILNIFKTKYEPPIDATSTIINLKIELINRDFAYAWDTSNQKLK